MGALRRESIKCCSILAISDNCIVKIPSKWPFRYSRCFFYEKLIRLFERVGIHRFGKRGKLTEPSQSCPLHPKPFRMRPRPSVRNDQISPFCLCESLSYHFIKVVTFYSQSAKNNEIVDRDSQGFIERNSSTGQNRRAFIFKRLRGRPSTRSKVAQVSHINSPHKIMTRRARKNKGDTKPTKNAVEPITGRAGSGPRAGEILIMAIFDSRQYQYSLTQKTPMNLSDSHPSPLLFRKIYFSVSRRVKFGQGVFVCGSTPELGNWDPSRSYRLKWAEGDLWSGSILLAGDAPETVEYKYIIADWDEPARAGMEWEVGAHNRRLDLAAPRTTTACDDRWNMDRVTLTLAVGRSRSPLEEKYYVVGDIAELGGWRERKLMKRVPRKAGAAISSRKENLSGPGQPSQQEYYSFTFYTYRSKEQFYYYYIKKGSTIQSERRPGRVFAFADQRAAHPCRSRVAHPRGEINVLDECNINELVFSRVTPQIFVGSYPKSTADILKLKENNITAVFSIQSERDFKSHGLTPHYLSLLCQEHGVRYKRYSILDMNNEDFVTKAEGGVKVMRDLIRDGERVYVHCSAGIYRSPQIIVLYLTLFERYSLDQAVSTVKANHPYAKPNARVLRDAVGLIQLHRNGRAVFA